MDLFEEKLMKHRRGNSLRLMLALLTAGCAAGSSRAPRATSDARVVDNPPPTSATDGAAPIAGGGEQPDAASDPRPRYYDVPPRVLPPSAPDVATINMKACQALKTGPFVPVTPPNAYSYMAPPLMTDNQAYRLAIAAGKFGFVSFVAPADAQYVVFTSTMMPFTVSSIEGEFKNFEETASIIPECMEVKGRTAYRLKMGTYVLRFGTQNIANVDVVMTTGVP
jgi:hypothetical protein